MALTVRAGLDDGSPSSTAAPAPARDGITGTRRSPSSNSAPFKASSTSVLSAVKQAVAVRRTATFSAEGAVGQGDDSFVSDGRLDYRSEEVSNYDLTVGSRDVSDPNSPYGPQRVVLFGKCAYLRDTPGSCSPPRSEQPELDDPHAWLAHEVRWVTSPYNIFALLRHSTSFEREPGAGTVTYRGTARTGSLAKGLGRLFYEQYAPVRTELTYILVTGVDNLPQRLDMSI
ncbi:hypothetical protein G3I24_13905, partial [Micromonospora aurantiaca]|nr:hypothetical protein [Micromonospora aurantiaca]